MYILSLQEKHVRSGGRAGRSGGAEEVEEVEEIDPEVEEFMFEVCSSTTKVIYALKIFFMIFGAIILYLFPPEIVVKIIAEVCF